MSKVTINGKVYELKEVAEGAATEVEEEETSTETEEVETEAAPAAGDSANETDLDAVAEKIVASLGLDKIHKRLDEISKAQQGSDVSGKKLSALLDLEALMNKDVSKMTVKEKVVGFFQAMVQSNHAVLKALSEGTAADGGYLFPDEFRAEIIRDIADTSYRMRNEVTVIPMRRDVMQIPTLASRPKVTWTDENAAKSTTTAHFGNVTLTVKKMAAILYASDELIADSTEVDIVQFIIGLFSEAIGEEEDRVVWRGNGTTEPTGIVTAKTAGAIGTVSGAAGLSIDLLLSLQFALPQRYHMNAKYYSHRNNILEMRKMKDNNGRYYWVDPVTAGSMPTFNGYPVIEINDLPESEVYFGDLRKTYWLGDRQRMTVKISQDTETAFTHDQTAIRVVSRIAGNVVLGAASRALVSLP